MVVLLVPFVALPRGAVEVFGFCPRLLEEMTLPPQLSGIYLLQAQALHTGASPPLRLSYGTNRGS